MKRKGIMKSGRSDDRVIIESESVATNKKKNYKNKKKIIVKNGWSSSSSSSSSLARLVKYEALPEYLQDNEFITDYYRCEWPLKDIVLSIFSWHNETLNIWTHLVGFVIFAWLTGVSLTENASVDSLMASFSFIRPAVEGPLMMMILNKTNSSHLLYPDRYPRQIPQPSSCKLDVSENEEFDDILPKWPWFVFLGGAMSCLVFSTLSHIFACHSKRFNLFFWRLDYAGISIMIVSSFFPPIYYTFFCHTYWRIFYLTTITFIGICAIFTLLAPDLSSRHFRNLRAGIFLAMGFTGVIPAVHAVILCLDHSKILVALGFEIIMAVLYAIGAAFYITRIPERWKPGAFDIVGHSHQIFHTFVVAAAIAHSYGTLVIMDWRRGLLACM